MQSIVLRDAKRDSSNSQPSAISLHTDFPDFMTGGGRLATRLLAVDRLDVNCILFLGDVVALVYIPSRHEFATVT